MSTHHISLPTTAASTAAAAKAATARDAAARPAPRLRFVAPLAAAASITALLAGAVGWQALEPPCETAYRSQLAAEGRSEAATAEGLIVYCAEAGR